MSASVILVTPDEEVDNLCASMRRVDPAIEIAAASSIAALRSAAAAAPDARLIGFCTPLIVPAEILSGRPGGAYNFHPGSPEFPGLFPACFAIHENARQFGATCHEMTADIDQGAIVGVTRCDMPADIDRLNLEALSRQLVTHLFNEMAPVLVRTDERPLSIDEKWRGPIRRRADFEALCVPPEGVDAVEFERRHRAVGEGPDHALRIPIHGRMFRLENIATDGRVYVGGRPR